MSDIESFTDSLCDALGVEFYSVDLINGDIRGTVINTTEFEVTIRRSGGSDE